VLVGLSTAVAGYYFLMLTGKEIFSAFISKISTQPGCVQTSASVFTAQNAIVGCAKCEINLVRRRFSCGAAWGKVGVEFFN
jgi:hypothetical protein